MRKILGNQYRVRFGMLTFIVVAGAMHLLGAEPEVLTIVGAVCGVAVALNVKPKLG